MIGLTAAMRRNSQKAAHVRISWFPLRGLHHHNDRDGASVARTSLTGTARACDLRSSFSLVCDTLSYPEYSSTSNLRRRAAWAGVHAYPGILTSSILYMRPPAAVETTRGGRDGGARPVDTK